MKKSILLNVLIIIAVVAITATATWAWFSAQDVTKTAQVTTAKLGIAGTDGFNLALTGLVPGETKQQDFNVQNTGTVAEDFYFQMIPEMGGSDFNFCYDGGVAYDPAVLRIWIQDRVTGQWWVNNENLCKLYPIDADAYIAKIGDDVPAGGTKYYTLFVKLIEGGDNTFQDKSNTDYINLIGVQANGPAPVSGHGVPFQVWPVGDPNY